MGTRFSGRHGYRGPEQEISDKELTGDAGLSEDESHGKAPHISIEFKRQVAQEFPPSLHGLSRRHDVSRNLIRALLGRVAAPYM